MSEHTQTTTPAVTTSWETSDTQTKWVERDRRPPTKSDTPKARADSAAISRGLTVRS